MVSKRGLCVFRALVNFSTVLNPRKMGPLENAKKIAAYKAVDEYVKVKFVNEITKRLQVIRTG